jgi:cobalt-zinc-cadmium efflux system membrane fusion protein
MRTALIAVACIAVLAGSWLIWVLASAPAAQEKPEAAETASNEASISAETARASGITVEVAGPAAIRETLTLYGSIRPNAEREQDLRARYPGVVRSVSLRPGEMASKGQTLVTVESNESLQTYPIRSPIAGSVLERHVNPGETVGSDTVLVKVADLSTVWAEFAVFARDLGRVRAGLPVTVTGSDTTQRTEATVAYVAPAGDADSQSVIARAVLDNANGRWVAGQFAAADVVLSQVQARVAVAPGAVQSIDGKSVVFVQSARGFQAREVTVGKQSREAVEILSGLNSGERYAAKNSYLIKADLLKGEAEED